jgi:hypothetical protein
VSIRNAGGAGDRAYLAWTPYHVLLSVAIQLRDGCPRAVMILADEANLLGRSPGLESQLGEFFELQHIRTSEDQPLWKMPVAARLGGREALAYIRAFSPEATVFVFNGLTPQAQYLGRSLEGRGRFECVEDGLDAYVPYNFRPIPWWRRALFRWTVGNDHPFVTDSMTAMPFARYHMLAPALARVPADADAEVEEIPGPCLVEALSILQGPLSVHLALGSITDVLLLDHSDRIADVGRCLEDVADWVHSVRGRHPIGNPRVKAHPRETDRALLDGVDGLGDVALPHWLPIEIYANCLRPDATIHCGLTTFIVSSRVLIPDRRVLLNDDVPPEHAEILTRWDPRVTVRNAGAGTDAHFVSEEDLCP